MSAPVDVLAVMDADASVLRSEMRRRNRKAMRSDHPEAAVRQERMKYLLAQNAEARAAVAELIEAANRAAIAAVRGDDNHPGTIRNADLDALRAALARVQGGAL